MCSLDCACGLSPNKGWGNVLKEKQMYTESVVPCLFTGKLLYSLNAAPGFLTYWFLNWPASFFQLTNTVYPFKQQHVLLARPDASKTSAVFIKAAVMVQCVYNNRTEGLLFLLFLNHGLKWVGSVYQEDWGYLYTYPATLENASFSLLFGFLSCENEAFWRLSSKWIHLKML